MHDDKMKKLILVLIVGIMLIGITTAGLEPPILTDKDKLTDYGEKIIKSEINYKTFDVINIKESKDNTKLMAIDVMIDGRSFTWYTTKENYKEITK